ncbi:hypothetical protein DFH08DRAFT_799533 [Mycena albidolilacea]|uniref:Uncharacterized protein n=1 Tax=Mycena albidolilacea TaxID=1033008 RepID=A0AAD7F0G2_9AGAR|nr:hypothetical protein DFH08DRAFT_799533 [Mycena albidolilacea]
MARNMQIGCGGNVTNLVAQYIVMIVPNSSVLIIASRNITATLSLAPLFAEKDLYEDTRKYPLVYDPVEDPVVIVETEEMEKDLKEGELEKDIHEPDPSGSDLSDSESDNKVEDLWVDEASAAASEMVTEEVQTEPEVDAEVEEAEMEEEAVTRKNGKAPGKGARKGKKGKKAKKAKLEKAFTPVNKIHASVIHILRSEIRCKKARVLIHKHAMKITVIWCSCAAWQGQSRSTREKEKMGDVLFELEFIDKLMSALEVLQDVTLKFFKKGVPTICKVLPLYKLMETKLAKLADEYELEEFNIARALRARSEKAKQYIGKALISDYPLLSAVLHPAIRLAFFETSDWDSEVPKRAHSLLMALVKKYSNSAAATSAHGSKPAKGIFARAVKGYTRLEGKMKLTCISVGFRRSSMASTIHMSGGREILAIPGVIIAVKQLFSSMKHTLTDDRTSMTPENSSMCIIKKERLKSRLCDGLDWTQLLNINEYS